MGNSDLNKFYNLNHPDSILKINIMVLFRVFLIDQTWTFKGGVKSLVKTFSDFKVAFFILERINTF